MLSNDTDPDGQLNPASIVIVTQPQHGTAFALANGMVRYVPTEDFAGNDSFTYRVSDTLGRASAPATVQVQVVASRVQNPVNSLDTDADGEISPIDALLIINFLNRFGPTAVNSLGIWQSDTQYGRGDVVQFNNRSWLASTVPAVGVPPADTGTSWISVAEPYYDIDGNQSVEPFDALTVINELNRRAREDRQGVSGEAVPSIDRVDAAPTFVVQDAAHSMLKQPSAKVINTDMAIASAGGSDEDLLDVLARDKAATSSSSDSENPFDTLWRGYK